MALAILALSRGKVAITRNAGQSPLRARWNKPCSRTGKDPRAGHDPAARPPVCSSTAFSPRQEAIGRIKRQAERAITVAQTSKWPGPGSGAESLQKGRRRMTRGDLGPLPPGKRSSTEGANRAWAQATAACCGHRSANRGGSAENPRPLPELEWVSRTTLTEPPG